MEIGWKAKAEGLRMVLLSAGHQCARELGPSLARTLEIFARVSVDALDSCVEEIQGLPPDDHQPRWDVIEVHGWKIRATLYLRDEQLWWLLHATRKNERSPSEKDIVFLDKILGHLGAELDRHEIISPRSSSEGQPFLPFGWWTWRNGWLLYEVQVNEGKVRVVPRGTPETDGYTRLRDEDLAADEVPR